MDTNLGAMLRSSRKAAGFTLEQLAEAVGLSAATLSRAETGQSTLTPERVQRCAEAMGIDVAMMGAVESGASGDAGGVPASGVESAEPGSWRRYGPMEAMPALKAALACFLRLGYHGASVREIAALAGLSVPGLYHHYPSKQDLLVAIMDLTMTDIHARCVAARDEGRTPVERFRLLVECFALFHSHRRELAFLGVSEMRSLEEPHFTRIVDLRNACQHMVDVEVQAMAEEGAIETPLPADAARAVVSMLVGIANWYRIDGTLTPEEIARRYVHHASAVVQLKTGSDLGHDEHSPSGSRTGSTPRPDGADAWPVDGRT